MADLELTKLHIHIDPATIAGARGLGSLDRDFQKAIEIAITKYSKMGIAAYQSWVPRRTEELRNLIKARTISQNFKEAIVQLYIPAVPHTTSPGRKKPDAAFLAYDILDVGLGRKGVKLHRRKSSRGVPGFAFSSPGVGTPTSGWIHSAYTELVTKINEDLAHG